MKVIEHTGELDGQPVRWLERGGRGVPTLYLHDMPLSADAWRPFLEAERGPAVAVDLPGFGLSGKGGRLPYDLAFYDAWIERFVDWIEFERFHLVAHGTGAVAMLTAQRMPERVGRIVLIAPLPFVPDFRWHKLARRWRRPVIGELVMGFSSRRIFRKLLPAELADPAWANFDQGTQRAMLRFHRSASASALAEAGSGLRNIASPILVLSPASDPYFAADQADAYGERMLLATVERVSRAGHWPWLDRAELVEQVTAYLRNEEGKSRTRAGR